jgi:hypothetical protein
VIAIRKKKLIFVAKNRVRYDLISEVPFLIKYEIKFEVKYEVKYKVKYEVKHEVNTISDIRQIMKSYGFMWHSSMPSNSYTIPLHETTSC